MRPLRQLAMLSLLATAVALAQGGRSAAAVPSSREGESLDRIVAIVNGDILLESDVEEEQNYAALQPFSDSTGSQREQAVNRLVDRALILQQQKGFPVQPVTDDEVNKEESDLRSSIPACAVAKCETDAGWQSFLASHQISEPELRTHLRLRIQVLRFVQQRFQAGAHISDEQVEEFYNKTMLPQYVAAHAPAPPLATLRDRIEQVLLQQQVSELLDQWLKSLRDEGHVRVLRQGEEAP